MVTTMRVCRLQFDSMRYVAGLTGALLLTAGCANPAARRVVDARLAELRSSDESVAAAYARSNPRPESVTQGVPAAAALSEGELSGGGVDSADASSQEQDPSDLYACILTALRDNPRVKAAEATAQAASARAAQMVSLPDPMVMTRTLPEPVRTAEGDNYFVLGVQQRIPVPGRLDRAGQAAMEEAKMALSDLDRTRLSVIADVKRAYYSLYVVDRTIEIDQANQDLLRGLIDVATAQVAAGRRAQDDVLRAQVEVSALEGDLIELRRRREALAAALNREMNRKPDAAVSVAADVALPSVDAQLEALLDVAAANNPDLKRLAHAIERDGHAAESARLAAWPELVLGFEWMLMEPRDPPPLPRQSGSYAPPPKNMSESGSDNWAILFGFTLPIWTDRIREGVRESRERLIASQQTLAAEQSRIDFEVAEALARVNAQRELAALFDRTIIPQARQAFETSRAGYASGRSDFLVVIDNWQKWLAVSIQYHRALGELQMAVADLESALGVSLAEAADAEGS